MLSVLLKQINNDRSGTGKTVVHDWQVTLFMG